MAQQRLTRKKVLDSLTTGDIIDLLSERVHTGLVEIGGDPFEHSQVAKYITGLDLKTKIINKVTGDLNDE